MPRKGYSAVHGVNPIFFLKKRTSIFSHLKYFVIPLSQIKINLKLLWQFT